MLNTAMEKNNNTNDGLPADAPPTGGATPEELAGDTVLHYLWADEPPEAAEPSAEDLFIQAARQSEDEQAAPACLESVLKDYSRWLGSIAGE